ncbi:unnamed protein product [Rotaria sp. Silwood1]|nr:unnamed protein product [Rotaria sp. Silwood1]CAF1559805.1 unnamed protein product [Rotaria sp. Silwood1]CAF1573657.1 unnamed protein product [Rotaria sp. Silwood1]CAF3686811.1 unnamed protein product [Rotaria sp. Silwood1]CAF4840128.1 unnamed protein product [Rotaria sp. Silwood1]
MIKHNSDSFVCWFCEKNLLNNRYVIKDNFAICLFCFEEKYSNHCFQCNQIIGIEMQGSIFKDKTWHNTCFNCSICNLSLINKKFAYQNNKLYCRHCFIDEFAQRCYRCNRSLEPGDKCIQYDKNLYHKSCFICNVCQKQLINENFRYRDQYIFCLSCYMNIIAIYCIKCHKAIANDGIVYHNHPFHQECFVCTHCSIPLGNQRYIEYNNDAYCSNCSSNLFIKTTNLTTQ